MKNYNRRQNIKKKRKTLLADYKLVWVSLFCIVISLSGFIFFSWLEFLDSTKVVDKQVLENSFIEEPNKRVESSYKGITLSLELPFEEPIEESLAEKILQVDYAILKSLSESGLVQSNIFLSKNGIFFLEDSPFTLRELNINTNGKLKIFENNLKSNLKKWVNSYEFIVADKGFWKIVIDNQETHYLHLYDNASSDFNNKYFLLSKKNRQLRRDGEPAILTIVIDDLGDSLSVVKRLSRLSFPVTCAFLPYGKRVEEGAILAHNSGLEVILHQPMEPIAYPSITPGPNALFVNMKEDKMLEVLEDSIKKVPFASGLNNHMGSRFTQSKRGINVVLEVAKRHNFFVLDSVTHGSSIFYKEAVEFGISSYKRTLFLDVKDNKEEVLNCLKQAEEIALLTGRAIVIGHPYSSTLKALEEWEKIRNKEVLIKPLEYQKNIAND